MLRFFRGLSLSIPLAALLLSPAFVGATSTVAVPVSELVRLSPVIVHGTVLSTESRWNEDHSLIVTDVRIGVLNTLRGQAVSDVVVTQPGGRVGKLRVEVDGAGAFRLGDETILFLSPHAGGRYSVSGLSQGRFDVRQDPRTGEKIVSGWMPPAVPSSVPGAVSPSGKPVPVLAPAPEAPATLPLDSFLGSVRDLVKDLEAGGRR
jgi:hypothetical protein